MKRAAFCVALGYVCLLLVGLSGCETKKKAENAGVEKADSVALCSSCGQVKGSVDCCKPGVAMCAKCGLAKGSPGCCLYQKGDKAVSLCTKCGQVKGSSLCCKPNATICPKCGLAKGSPGCCKINEPSMGSKKM